MSDREALAAALKLMPVERSVVEAGMVEDAADKYLAQLPEKCGTCDGTGKRVRGSSYLVNCIPCHGKGVLYDPVLTKRISDAVRLARGPVAVAVLDALNEFPAPEEGG